MAKTNLGREAKTSRDMEELPVQCTPGGAISEVKITR